MGCIFSNPITTTNQETQRQSTNLLHDNFEYNDKLFNEKVEKEMQEWEVRMYAENSHLVMIPQKRKLEKRAQIRKRLQRNMY